MLKKRIIPLLLILAGLWGLAGCIWLPIPEHQVSKGKDFRGLLGPDPDHSRNLGLITREMVIRALGPPPYRSQDGRAIGYAVERDAGVIIWPLCFSGSAATRYTYTARLIFDKNDRLITWEMKHGYQDQDGMYNPPTDQLDENLVFDLNQTEPKLLPTTTRPTSN